MIFNKSKKCSLIWCKCAKNCKMSIALKIIDYSCSISKILTCVVCATIYLVGSGFCLSNLMSTNLSFSELIIQGILINVTVSPFLICSYLQHVSLQCQILLCSQKNDSVVFLLSRYHYKLDVLLLNHLNIGDLTRSERKQRFRNLLFFQHKNSPLRRISIFMWLFSSVMIWCFDFFNGEQLMNLNQRLIFHKVFYSFGVLSVVLFVFQKLCNFILLLHL